ncbi:MAG: FtsX-like permease family protein, partial [Gammaproteobacteria bacterium]
RALGTEKIAMFVILALAIAIAAFNLVSILVVAVTEKRGDVAMLGALGMTRGRIMRIFFLQGGITGVLGVLAGLALGYLLAVNVGALVAWFESALGFRVFSPEVYYISAIPSEPRWPDFVVTAVFALALALAAPLYPAWLAARPSPAEGLRHE